MRLIDLLVATCLTEPGSGSDALSISTRSKKVGNQWVIQGSKTFITNAPIADFFIVVTRTEGSGINGGTMFEAGFGETTFFGTNIAGGLIKDVLSY